MAHFPVFMDLTARKCMIFGGGKVALRKIETLLRYDADLELIADEILPEIRELLPERVHGMEEKPLNDWLSRADLVIAATSDRALNHRISSYCHAHHLLVNVVDAPEECSFLFPSVVKRGDISIGINTGAQSPIVSKKLRKEIEELVPEYYGEIAAWLGDMRKLVKGGFDRQEDRQKALKTLAAEAFSRERPLTKEEICESFPHFSCIFR